MHIDEWLDRENRLFRRGMIFALAFPTIFAAFVFYLAANDMAKNEEPPRTCIQMEGANDD